jgi:hypothetical protein
VLTFAVLILLGGKLVVAGAVLLAFFLPWKHRRADPMIALRLACEHSR